MGTTWYPPGDVTMRKLLAAPLLVFGLLFSTAAIAAPTGHTPAATKVKPTKPAKPAAGTPADQYKKQVAKKISLLRNQFQKELKKHHVDAANTKILNASLENKIKRAQAEVDRVCADGNVTAEEKKQVEAVAKELAKEMQAEVAAKGGKKNPLESA